MNRIVQALGKANVAIDGTVTQVTEDGVVLEKIICTFGDKVEVKKAEISGEAVGSRGALSRDRTPVVEYTIKTKWVQPRAFEEGPVFVICDTRGIVDRQRFRAIVFPAGVYKDGRKFLSHVDGVSGFLCLRGRAGSHPGLGAPAHPGQV